MHPLFKGLWLANEVYRTVKGLTEDDSDAPIIVAPAGASPGSVEDRLDRLLLVCSAMWELLREKTGLTEEDLMAKVQEMDLRDGSPDGKVRKQVLKCVQCGRTMSRRHHRCLYCGAQELNPQAFDAAG